MIERKIRQPSTRFASLHNAIWGGAGSLLYGGGRFVVFMIFAKLMPTVVMGYFVLAWAIVVPLAYLLNMELRIVLATDSSREISPGDCLSLRLISNALLIITLFAICLIQTGRWPAEKCYALLLVGGIRIVESWGEILLAVPQRHEQIRLAALSHGLKLLGVLVWLWWIWLHGWQMPAALLGWLVITLLVVMFYDLPMADRFERIKFRWRQVDYSRLVRAGVTLGVFMALVHANDKIGQYFAELRLADTSVAYLGALAATASGMLLLQAGVNQAFLPRLARYRIEGGRAFGGLLLKMLTASWLFSAVAIAVVWWQGGLILSVLFKADYAAAADAFVVIVAGAGVLLSAMILGDAVVACHNFIGRMFAVAAGVAVNLCLCWLFVRGENGLMAAAWAAAASAAVTTVCCGLVLLRARRN